MSNSLSEISDVTQFSKYAGTYEVFKDVNLNGVDVDFLFLDKNKGAVILNIVTNKEQFDYKRDSLSICKSHLYLSTKLSKFVTLFVICQDNIQIDENVQKIPDVIFLQLKNEFNIESKITKLILKNDDFSENLELANILYQKIKALFFYKRTECDFSLALSKEQLSIIRDDSVKKRRVAGAAGSGKSLIVALKAARALRQGKSVLITSYNITMMNYIRKLITDGLNKPELYEYNFTSEKSENIDITKLRTIHFHGILGNLRSILIKHFYSIKRSELNLLDEDTPNKLLQCLKKFPQIFNEVRADCILSMRDKILK